MKKLTIIMLSLVALIATSCTKYNEKTCEDLCVKINDGKKLTDDDYAECIKQCSAIIDELSGQLEKIKSKAEDKNDEAIDMWDDFESDNDVMLEHLSTMNNALSYADLKGENKTNFKELEKQWKEFARLVEKTHRKVRRLDD